MRFEGKTAVITGGSSGIGRGTVDLFLREGATVVMGDIDEAEGTAMMSALGDNFLFKTCDVTQEDQVKALMDHAAEKKKGSSGSSISAQGPVGWKFSGIRSG